MNIIFLTLSHIEDVEERGIYSDLMRMFRDRGGMVYIVSPLERRYRGRTRLSQRNGVHLLNVKTLNIQKTNIIEKGIGTLLLEWQFQCAIQKYLKGIEFNLILYSTPPITFTNVVKYLKKRNPEAISYLLLKDIFPQNAVDMRMFSKRSVFYHFFRQKEMALYRISDYIGCMSDANVEFLRSHNSYYQKWRVEVAPNSIELRAEEGEIVDKNYIRKKYGLPLEKTIFIYGGNLGKPQGIDYLIKCLEEIKYRDDCFFVITGNGTEFHKLRSWYDKETAGKEETKNDRKLNVVLMQGLPKDEYEQLVQSCDVGLIFLDYRFTIPNYPSRLLSYLENKMPVICATDVNTDIGKVAEQNGYGYWCESVWPIDFTVLVDRFLAEPERIKKMGERGYEFLKNHYLVEHTYKTIMNHFH